MTFHKLIDNNSKIAATIIVLIEESFQDNNNYESISGELVVLTWRNEPKFIFQEMIDKSVYYLNVR